MGQSLFDVVPPLSGRPSTDTTTITVPAMIVGGDRGELLPRHEQERLCAAIPGSTLVV